MEIISIINQKGGVAKTTTAINLGASLAEMGYDVLLLDLDPQANLTLGLGFGKIEDNSYKIMKREINFEDAIHPTDFGEENWGSLDLIPSHIKLANIELELSSELGRETVLNDAFEESQVDGYDYLIIDTNPSLGLLTVNAMSLSHKMIVPMEPNIFALDGIEQLVNIYKQVKKKFNEDLKIEGALLTKIDGRTNIGKHFTEELREVFGDKFFQTTINQNVKLNEAQLEGEPINIYDSQARGAKQYKQLAKEMVNRG